MALPGPCLSVRAVASMLSVSTHHVYDLIAAGHLAAIRVGERRMSIPETELERFVAERSTRSAA